MEEKEEKRCRRRLRRQSLGGKKDNGEKGATFVKHFEPMEYMQRRKTGEREGQVKERTGDEGVKEDSPIPTSIVIASMRRAFV